MFDSLLLNAVLAFLSMFIVDFINAIYIRHIQNDSAIASASTSVFIFLGTFLGVLVNKKYIGVVIEKEPG